MHRAVASLAIAALASTAPLAATEPRIVIDGAFDDWRGPIPAAEDPFDAPGVELDLGRIAVAHDAGAVYIQLEFAGTVLPQGLDGTATLLFDADGDSTTGAPQLSVPGVDVAVVFSPPQPDWTSGARGITARSVGSPAGAPGRTLTSYDLGLMIAPTHAANRFELRLERGVTLPGTGELFRAGSFAVAFAYVGPDGEIGERSDILTYTFGPASPEPATRDEARDPLARAEGTELRIVSWNVGARAIVDRAGDFFRVLSALSPDVVLFDEVPGDVAPTALLASFGGLPAPSDRAWQAAVGPGGGRQHAAVLSHHPVRLAPELARVTYPEDFAAFLTTIDRPWIQEDLAGAATEGVSTAGFVIAAGERQLLALPVDLQCCGRVGEPEDRIREIQAEAIRRAVAAALPDLDLDGVVLAGDLNMVGSRAPLEILRRGLDVDGSDLEVVDAIQLDGRSADADPNTTGHRPQEASW